LHGVRAAEVSYQASGVSDAALANVLSHVSAFSFRRQSDISSAEYDDILADAVRKTKVALRPYGYYHPAVTGQVQRKANGDIVVQLTIEPGLPVLVDQVDIAIAGEGADAALVRQWRQGWPLVSGKVLDQTVWEDQKQFIVDELRTIGYLGAKFTERRVELDLEAYRANLKLVLDTGPRYLFGEIDFGQHILQPGIVEYIPRFEPGQPFDTKILDKFRVDLWKSGYFTEVLVEEQPRQERVPPVVDLKVRLQTTTRNTYQGAIGYGTDTEARLQAQWSRHPMSSSGDRIDVGIGWQQLDDEYLLRATYRVPRRNRARQFWTSDLTFRHENIDLDVRPSPDAEFIRIATGNIDERHLRAGRMKVRNFKSGHAQAFETLFIQALDASDELRLVEQTITQSAPGIEPLVEGLLRGSNQAVSIGFDYDLVAINGKGWETDGHRDRAWIFGTGGFLGSSDKFTQLYASTRRSYLKGERWKFILRAEAGYTDAKVENIDVDLGGTPLSLSLTELPNFYRFRAGGSQSVRGYGFEELSNNHIGSNHIVTASAEVEMKFLSNWSAALFFDIGNAFNDWSDPQLKRGVGVGIRWYSIAGPIRVDVAQALDLIDKPWRLHFTIGTPLL
jgi:translocation and assembly module TamA